VDGRQARSGAPPAHLSLVRDRRQGPGPGVRAGACRRSGSDRQRGRASLLSGSAGTGSGIAAAPGPLV